MSDIDQSLKKFVNEAEAAFAKGLDFANGSKLQQVADEILRELDDYKIGPAVLCLLVTFTVREELRKELWDDLRQLLRERNK